MSRVWARLKGLREQGLFTDLDIHFASLMGRLSGDDSFELLLAAALTSHTNSEGNVCLPLSQWSDRHLGSEGGGWQFQLPSLPDWIDRLRQSRVVGYPGETAPLILDHAGRLYLYRYWDYEQRLAMALLARARAEIEITDLPRLEQELNRLFPAQPGIRTDWQKIAACVTVMKRLAVISGGPGTGKTSTVVRILALLQQQAGEHPLAIALAAPTGKAAARLQTSIQHAKAQLPVEPSLLECLPDQAMTLHRLMGNRVDSVQSRHDAAHPLPVDLLVIDEASMVDVALMAKVVAALPPEARLILLGDRNQLSSVEAGAVLGDICGERRGFTRRFSDRLCRVRGLEFPAHTEADSPLSDAVIELSHSYRFDRDSGIGQLADAVNRGDAPLAHALLDDHRLTDISQLPMAVDPVDVAVAGYHDYLQRIRDAAPVDSVFAAFDGFRVLCALRTGPAGVFSLNQTIEEGLLKEGMIPPDERWYPGRPILVTRNDYSLKLYNGDIGILLVDDQGHRNVCFPTLRGVRRVAPARLPPHETAFAMTVHKSQGSEFDRVLLVLPQSENRLLSRELLYTGLTRSRKAFILSDEADLLTSALRVCTRRASGLRALLWGGVE